MRLGVAAAALVGCAETQKPGEPTFYRSMASAGAQLDASAAASMISGYRAQQWAAAGDARSHADAACRGAGARHGGARQDHHNTGGAAFIERLRRSGYDAKVAAENISAGYHTLAEAFSGWRDSPPHRANMLLKGADRMGIAAIYAPGSKYKVFWALILAAPDDPRG